MIFVNSMSDLFHEELQLNVIQKIFNTMKRASWHTFQVLTKRSARLLELDPFINWPPNVWMGVSIENQDYIPRIDQLRQIHASVKFLSFEPLLGPLPNLDLDHIDWVIVGGESGPRARPIKKEWIIDIRNRCQKKGIPFFFKQWGGVNKKKNGRSLEGQTWDKLPDEADLFLT
jgi:protein gp37